MTPKPQGKAMYVASELDKSWLLSVQRKLYRRSQQHLTSQWTVESPVHNERCTPGSGVGAAETAGSDRGMASQSHFHRNIQHTVAYTQLAPQRFNGFWDD